VTISGAVALAWLIATVAGIMLPSGKTTAAILVMGAIAGLAVAVAGVATVMRRVAMPLGGVMDAADRVAAGDYDVRVAEGGPPSIRALARAFNTMTERLQSHDRLRKNLMADISHELRTPLTVIQGKLEGLLDGVYPRDEAQLKQLLEETHLLSRLVEDLRTLALSESGALRLAREPTDLASLARHVARAFAAEGAACGVAIGVDAPETLASIDVDPLRMREVLSNLLSNALRHTPPGGSVTLRVAPTPDGATTIDVRDTGSGMSADEVAHAFDRFYKGSSSRGSGLGLTIAKSLVVAHGGDIRVSSSPGTGTTVSFTLPSGAIS